jgi:NAD(P)-dependent dehydrogenase (short-subunit alcohol dehydrogenase family)
VTRPVALVTGARRGLGRAIAVALAGRGFDLVLNDLEQGDELERTAAMVVEAGARAIGAPADIADLAQHDGLLDAAWGAGPVACLVNNAGVSVAVRGDLLEVGVASYDRCLAVNTRGTFFLTQAFARRLLAAADPGTHHRSIVIVSSANAEAVALARGEYCVSKAALAMVAKLFAVRLAGLGIGVYEIRPGIIATEMTAPSRARYDAFLAAGRNPIPRWGEPAEVARCVTACAAGELPYTAGQVLKVDGGLTIPQL